jgi:hypothetical protein
MATFKTTAVRTSNPILYYFHILIVRVLGWQRITLQYFKLSHRLVFYYATMLQHVQQTIFFPWGGVKPSPLLLRPPDGLLHQPRMMVDDDVCGAVGGMSGRGNWSTRRKPAPEPLCSLKIAHILTRARARAAKVGSRWLTASSTALGRNLKMFIQ